MKAVIVICFFSIVALVVGVNVMNGAPDAPVIEQSEVTTDVPH